MAENRTGRRRWIRWVVAGVIVVVVLAVAVPFVFIHFIEGSAPPKLALPSTATTAAGSATTSASAAVGVGGTWHVGSGSVAGYRVDEVLIGQHTTAVGRTSQISGSLDISGGTVTAGDFTVDMASVKSDQSQRNAQFDGRIMDVAQYPTASLRLSAPIDLGTIPAQGATASYRASGELTMHGVTRAVSFPVSAERTASGIDVLADVPITFADWNIANPSIGGFVTTASNGTLEALLHLTQGAGNPPVSAGSSAQGSGPSGPPSPVTVPPTTVPPLRIGSGG